MDFKQPLSVCEQTKYLSQNKRVVYNNISESDAQEILYKYNYINVITPFKYRFARKTKQGFTIKDANNNHIYDRDVDFKEYFDLYLKEREAYPTLYKNIMNFEVILNAIISYECLCSYNLETTENFNDFINNLEVNISELDWDDYKKNKLLEVVQNLPSELELYKSPYILFDNLTLNEILVVLIGMKKEIQQKCINEIVLRQQIVLATDIDTFYEQASKIVRIRNCICHNDSIEILLRFRCRHNKTIRKSSDKKSYANLIYKLSQ